MRSESARTGMSGFNKLLTTGPGLSWIELLHTTGQRMFHHRPVVNTGENILAIKQIYKITVIKWEKYNPNPKQGFRRAMISHGFLIDPKIRQLTPCTKLLYLSLLLVAGESQQSQVEVSHESLVFQSGVKSGSIQSQLTLLESLQLVTLGTKIALKRSGKERKGKERKGGRIENLPMPSAPAPATIPVYCQLWKEKYGTNPPINGRAAGQLTRLAKDLGQERTGKLIGAYLQMPDPWFVTKRHDIATLLANLNAVAQFLDTGKQITRNEIQNMETSSALSAQLERLGARP